MSILCFVSLDKFFIRSHTHTHTQDMNGEAQSEVIMPTNSLPTLDYGQDITETCDQVAVEIPPSGVEEQLEPGTQRQYSLNDFELIR